MKARSTYKLFLVVDLILYLGLFDTVGVAAFYHRGSDSPCDGSTYDFFAEHLLEAQIISSPKINPPYVYLYTISESQHCIKEVLTLADGTRDPPSIRPFS